MTVGYQLLFDKLTGEADLDGTVPPATGRVRHYWSRRTFTVLGVNDKRLTTTHASLYRFGNDVQYATLSCYY